MEELKDYIMAEMLFDPTLDPDILIAEFLDGYYGSAAPFIRSYMDTMHASVNETGHFLKACCVQPPAGVRSQAIKKSTIALAVLRLIGVITGQQIVLDADGTAEVCNGIQGGFGRPLAI